MGTWGGLGALGVELDKGDKLPPSSRHLETLNPKPLNLR